MQAAHKPNKVQLSLTPHGLMFKRLKKTLAP